MTPKESIPFINCAVLTFARNRGKDKAKYYEAYGIAEEALEKQMPKKPIVYKQYDTGKVVGYVCPKCKCDEIYSGIYRYDYCRDCGQAIDWSDEE